MKEERLQRVEMLLGTRGMELCHTARVLVLGVGGVGSWCAESLLRSGIGHLTLVDPDIVQPSNCNRQRMATTLTTGEPKAEAMRRLLLDIAPSASITALPTAYNASTADSLHLEEYDYIIDAIDSLADKCHLILRATSLGRNTAAGTPHSSKELFHPSTNTPHPPTLFSSMGAARRIDPTRVRTAEFWKVKGDALARALRQRFKHDGTFPARKFTCVYSEEPPLPHLAEATPEEATTRAGDASESLRISTPTPCRANGSLCPVTATFGLALSSLVLQDILRQAKQQ